MSRARDLSLVALGLLAGVGLTPHAADMSGTQGRFEAGYGKCHASAPDEGTWQQRGLTHQLQLSDKCGEVGAVWEFTHDVSFGARYVNFGQFASYAIANNDPQDKAELRGSISTDHTRQECQQKNGAAITGLTEDCHYRWNGSGHLNAFLFSIAWHPLHFGDLKLGGEVGMAVYKSTWRMVIQPTQEDWQYQYDQRSGWQSAPEFGASAYYKWLYAAYRIYMIPDGAPITPGYRSPVRQFVAGLSIPF